MGITLMSIMAFRKKSVAALWGMNILFLALMLAASVLNDANGRFPGLGETSSRAALISIVVLGLAADGLAGLLDGNGKRRAITIAVAIIYLLMLVPVFA